MKVNTRTHWRCVISVTSCVFHGPDVIQAFLQRSSSLEETKAPECCTLLGCYNDAVMARFEVDA